MFGRIDLIIFEIEPVLFRIGTEFHTPTQMPVPAMTITYSNGKAEAMGKVWDAMTQKGACPQIGIYPAEPGEVAVVVRLHVGLDEGIASSLERNAGFRLPWDAGMRLCTRSRGDFSSRDFMRFATKSQECGFFCMNLLAGNGGVIGKASGRFVELPL